MGLSDINQVCRYGDGKRINSQRERGVLLLLLLLLLYLRCVILSVYLGKRETVDG